MNKTLLTGLLCCSLSIQSFADQPLEGFTYGSVNAPTEKRVGISLKTWRSTKSSRMLISFRSSIWIMPARYCRENSKYWQSLDGDWKFHWAPDPDSRPKDFYQTEYDVSSWDAIPVPSSWNIYGIQKGRKPEVRNAYLRQPTGHLPAQRESG